MKKTGRFVLSKETLRRLDSGDLSRAVGQSRVSETSFCEVACDDNQVPVTSLANQC